MTAQLMKNGHANVLKNSIFETPAAEFKEIFEGYVAYYGSYNFNKEEQILTHHVLGAQSGLIW